MAILITARSVNQGYEWVAHARIARTEKLPDDVIERIRTRGDLAALPPRYARPARVVQHVLAYESIPQDLQDQVKGDLGIPGLVELVAGAVLDRHGPTEAFDGLARFLDQDANEVPGW